MMSIYKYFNIKRYQYDLDEICQETDDIRKMN